MTVTERFLKYVSYDTGSDEDSPSIPSTAKQKVLGRYLADELASIGLTDAHMDEYGYVYASIPASAGAENEPVIGLIAHMDTVSHIPCADIKPRMIRYNGGDIRLDSGVTIEGKLFPNLALYKGQDLIVTDGTTVLGADDKAGIAEIMTAAEYLIAHPEIRHGKVAVAFTPDEEIGRGADQFDVAGFGAQFAYTVDGLTLGELEYETFNAAAATFTVNGVSIHPGSAKNRMKNAALIAAELIGLFPAAEAPAHTEGYEGFYHVSSVEGIDASATVKMIIRDHDRDKFEARKAFAARVAAYLNDKYGEGTVEAKITDSYYNMREVIEDHMDIVERAAKTFRDCGVDPVSNPVRGGTDGSRLSFMGLPCPNLSAGAENAHGVMEFVSVQTLEKMSAVLVKLVTVQ